MGRRDGEPRTGGASTTRKEHGAGCHVVGVHEEDSVGVGPLIGDRKEGRARGQCLQGMTQGDWHVGRGGGRAAVSQARVLRGARLARSLVTVELPKTCKQCAPPLVGPGVGQAHAPSLCTFLAAHQM
jgi:hypothetical protein